MSVLMMINLKGGVAKTTNCVAMAECLATRGYRVLVIDADHQCMAGELLLGHERMYACEHKKKTLHDLLAAMLKDDFAPEAIPAYIESGASNIGGGIETLDVLPCSIRIDDFATNAAKGGQGFRTREEFLRSFQRHLAALKAHLHEQYNFILVDCPPSFALQVHYLMKVADGFVIPCIPDRLSVRGAIWLLERLRRAGFSRPHPVGTLWSLYRTNVAMHNAVIDAAAHGEEPLDQLPRPFNTIIPNASKILSATDGGQHPRTYSAKYSPQFAGLYGNVCTELARRTQKGELRAGSAL